MSKSTVSKLTIKTEFQALRCEVCHQADLFDTTTNLCARCDKYLSIQQEKQHWTLPDTVAPPLRLGWERIALGLVLGVCLPFILFFAVECLFLAPEKALILSYLRHHLRSPTPVR
jgi:hypothetical protein